jgi:hypothetical protein
MRLFNWEKSQLKFKNSNFYNFSHYWSNINRKKIAEAVTDSITLLTIAIRRIEVQPTLSW